MFEISLQFPKFKLHIIVELALIFQHCIFKQKLIEYLLCIYNI